MNSHRRSLFSSVSSIKQTAPTISSTFKCLKPLESCCTNVIYASWINSIAFITAAIFYSLLHSFPNWDYRTDRRTDTSKREYASTQHRHNALLQSETKHTNATTNEWFESGIEAMKTAEMATTNIESTLYSPPALVPTLCINHSSGFTHLWMESK